mmetsp:Transcript_11610/g.43609  ORF Transcript_11610/g.43609 Transcript_11610/m.43609 type:complete len:264 (-) Transcript_11610:37-828(-)
MRVHVCWGTSCHKQDEWNWQFLLHPSNKHLPTTMTSASLPSNPLPAMHPLQNHLSASPPSAFCETHPAGVQNPLLDSRYYTSDYAVASRFAAALHCFRFRHSEASEQHKSLNSGDVDAVKNSLSSLVEHASHDEEKKDEPKINISTASDAPESCDSFEGTVSIPGDFFELASCLAPHECIIPSLSRSTNDHTPKEPRKKNPLHRALRRGRKGLRNMFKKRSNKVLGVATVEVHDPHKERGTLEVLSLHPSFCTRKELIHEISK